MYEQSANPKVWHIFYSYADEDEDLTQSLDQHLSNLRSEGKIEREPRWNVGPGAPYQETIDKDFGRADIILLFISPDYMSSPASQIEMKIALQRANANEVYAVPILLRPVDWQESSIGHLNPLPRNKVPVTSWQNQDEALLEIAKGIRQIVESNDEATHQSRESNIGRQAPSSITTRPGQLIYSYQAHSREVYSVAWSPDGGRIASGGSDGEIHVWRADNGKHLLTYGQQIKSFLPNAVLVISWSYDGHYIASGTNLEKIQVWDAQSGQKIATLPRFLPIPAGFHFLSWSPRAYTIASTDINDHTVHLWNATNGQQLASIDLHSVLKITATSPGPMAWSPDGQQLVAGWDRFVHCYYVPAKKRLFVYDQHKNYVIGVAWSRDPRYIVSCDKAEIHVWYRETLAIVVKYVAHDARIRSFALSPNGRYVASYSENGTVHIWETITGRQQLVYRGHRDVVTSVSWSPDGKHVASASKDGSVQVWQAPD